MHRLAGLREVQDKGARAQAQRAVELLELLEVDGENPVAIAEADALLDAYLHDPYLTKNAGD
jgi:hypothetical protein